MQQAEISKDIANNTINHLGIIYVSWLINPTTLKTQRLKNTWMSEKFQEELLNIF